MRRFQIAHLPVLLLLATACGEAPVMEPELPPGCAPMLACQVSGVDLAIESLSVLPGPLGTDPVTGMLVFEPDQLLSVAITVRNRGDTRSAPDSVAVGSVLVVIPPLDPGHFFSAQVPQTPRYSHLISQDTRVHVRLLGAGAGDPFYGNDERFTDSFIVAAPVLRAELLFPDTVREEEPFSATVTIHNDSRFAASVPMAMAFCMFDFDVGCGSWAGKAYHLTELPAIPAGSSWTSTMTVTVPQIDVAHYSNWNWDLMACVQDAGSTLEDFLNWAERTCIRPSRPIRVLATLSP